MLNFLRNIFVRLCRKSRKSQWKVILIISGLCSCFLLLLHYYLWDMEDSEDSLFEKKGEIIDLTNEDKGGIINLTNICLPNEDAYFRNGDFLVNTEKCRIPKLDIWNEDAKRHPVSDNAEFNCSSKDLKITYVEGNKVVINVSALEILGFKLSTVSCCYRAIHRVEVTLTNYDKNADNHIRYSRNCTKMTRITHPPSRYIKVICHPQLLPRYDPCTYVNFHAIPLLHELPSEALHESTSVKYESAIRDKIKFWNDCKKSGQFLPLPNVLLIGIDSTSRMHFRRFLKKSIGVLESIGAVEMLGFTKVGLNTLPNFIPTMTLHSLDDIRKICFTNDSDPIDDCPFIWKNFSQQNYLTALMEDCPGLAIFNYFRTGFVEQPTDIYFRPLMLAMYRYLREEYTMSCMKYQRPEEMILRSVADLAVAAKERNLPFFITTWMTDLTHEDFNALEMMDDVLSETIEKLRGYNVLDNTLLLVVSDHGYRFLPIRKTLSGFYEDKLPALWIHVPESIEKMIVGSKKNVMRNQRSLISPYDIHATLKHILSMNAKEPRENDGVFRSGIGISLFSEIPPRSCEESGIPREFCACHVPIAFDKDHDIIGNAANAAVARINEAFHDLPACSSLRLSYVFSSCVMRDKWSTNTPLASNDVLLVGFVTTPGQFSFESHVGFDPGSGTFTKVISHVRADKIKVPASCIAKAQNFSFLEELCFCRQLKQV